MVTMMYMQKLSQYAIPTSTKSRHFNESRTYQDNVEVVSDSFTLYLISNFPSTFIMYDMSVQVHEPDLQRFSGCIP